MAGRLDPGWSFSTLFLVKDSLAIMLEAAGLLEEALREYYELEACYLESLSDGGALAGRDFGARQARLHACAVCICSRLHAICSIHTTARKVLACA